MFNLFKRTTSSHATRVFGKLNNHLGVVERNLQKVRAFNIGIDHNIINAGPLLKLIYSFNISLAMDGSRYRSIIADELFELCAGVGITTSVNPGNIFTNDIFGEHIDVIYIGHSGSNSTFDGSGQLLDWKNQSPVKVLHSPVSDLNLDMPTGVASSDARGVAVLSVDVPMLALQYRAWRKVNDEREAGERETPKQYLQDFVFNNLLESQLRVALYNRFVNASTSIESLWSYRKPVTPIIDYALKIDGGYKRVADYLEGHATEVEQLLESIVVGPNSTVADLLPSLDVTPTRSVYWALLIAFIPYLDFIVGHLYLYDSKINRQFTTKLKREIKRIRTDKVSLGAPNRDYSNYIDEKLGVLYELL